MHHPLNWVDIGALGDIPMQGARRVEHPAGRIAVFRTADDQIFALRDACPHKKGPLSEGIVHGHAVTCPLHNWVIDLATGEAMGPDEGCTGHIPSRLVDGRVLLGFTG
jgi:nitrite reductase (NADH) small subunit